ncbi:MAG: hypothetical protein JWO80_2555 [Bryobacterales bacterium]|nr:hypothetical protein [Bryobacterales bacterium]
MIQPVTTAASSSTAHTTKPWAPGDPSSFEQLFSNYQAASIPAPAPAPQPTTSTPAALFTFEQNATVTGYGTTTQMNPEELATAETADRLASMLGGKVVNEPGFGGGWSTSTPTRDIAFSGSNVTLNAGITAYLFNTYGDAPGSQAWQQINHVLGRDPMSTGPIS